MNDENRVPLATLVQGKLEADTAFHATLDGLSDDDKAARIAEKKAELMEAEFAKVNDVAENQRIRAEKAERGKKPEDAPPPAPSPADTKDDLSATDIYALHGANVHIDDIEEVKNTAKILGKSIPDALKDDIVITILEKRSEQRKTSEATNIEGGRPGATDTTDQELLANAAKGVIPAPGTKEAERLFWLRRGGKR